MPEFSEEARTHGDGQAFGLGRVVPPRREEALARLERAQQDQALSSVQTRGVLRGTRRDLQSLDRRLERIERGLSGKSLMALAQTFITLVTGGLVLWAAFHGTSLSH